jgi:hypothetical protein
MITCIECGDMFVGFKEDTCPNCLRKYLLDKEQVCPLDKEERYELEQLLSEEI